MLPDYIIKRLNKKGYKENSIKAFDGRIKNIYKYVMPDLMDEMFDKEDIRNNTNEIIAFIMSLKNKKIAKLYLYSLKAILSPHDFIPFKDITDSISKYVSIKSQYTPASKSRQNKFITLENLRNQYIKMPKTYDLNYLLFSLYTYLPPLRLEDYYNLERKDNGKNNYISNTHIILRKYKTVKTHGVRKIRIPSHLMLIIRKYMKDYHHNKYVIIDNFGDNITQTAMTQRLKRLLGISVHILRQIFTAEVKRYLQNNHSRRVKVIKKLSYILGHSLATNEFIYSGYLQTQKLWSSDLFMEYIVNMIMEI